MRPAHGADLERLAGVVERVTYHNEQNGWSVLRVSPFRRGGVATVVVHQARVHAGATMEFWGAWSRHPKHGEQFRAVRSLERRPATEAALEKYLGSGLISGVGPATARKIVSFFKNRTLEVFESSIEELARVPGIAEKKLRKIRTSWDEHKAVRDVMIFLQGHGISTLFSAKIYKTYGDRSVQVVSENPYRLARDIYGIGFFSADRMALSMGLQRQGTPRIEAGIRHVLAAGRDDGHCFLTREQISDRTGELLGESIPPGRMGEVLDGLRDSGEVRTRAAEGGERFYSRALYHAESRTAGRIAGLLSGRPSADAGRIESWVGRYCGRFGIELSGEQRRAVCEIPKRPVSILTGGPGCGKTTCTRVLVKLLEAMGRRVSLAAPTGRAAQRMSEVMGAPAKTIHRLLEWDPGKNSFRFDEENPLRTDFLVLDEASMLDITLACGLLRALPEGAQLLLIGDPDQLPAVGAGDVLADLLKTRSVPRFRLTRVFRQARESRIIRFAHEINSGRTPRIDSPVASPGAVAKGADCLFVDADEATREQAGFLRRFRQACERAGGEGVLVKGGEDWAGRIRDSGGGAELDPAHLPPPGGEAGVPVLSIPERYRHVDLDALVRAESEVEGLLEVLKSVHPWSTLRFGLTAVETTLRLYTKTVAEWLGPGREIQVLSPQLRGSLGTLALNQALQEAVNPEAPGKGELAVAGGVLRVGDRVIQNRNNYDLGVFNGDIGRVAGVDHSGPSCEVEFPGGGGRRVRFQREALGELRLAYSITIHKAQGSEFEVVIIPVLGQHYNMLFRNLVYTGLTRAKRLAVFVGTRKALAMAVGRTGNRRRQTALDELVDGPPGGAEDR